MLSPGPAAEARAQALTATPALGCLQQQHPMAGEAPAQPGHEGSAACMGPSPPLVTQHTSSCLSTQPFVPLFSFIPAGSPLGLAEPQRGLSGSGSSWSCWRAGTGTPEPLPNLQPFPNWAKPQQPWTEGADLSAVQVEALSSQLHHCWVLCWL